MTPTITVTEHGPYRVEGPVEIRNVAGATLRSGGVNHLCRCGGSRHKPFCDGSHWYAGFRDPQPEGERVRPPSLYTWAGGMPALRRLTARFYESIGEDPDPVLEPIFRHMDPRHPEHVAV